MSCPGRPRQRTSGFKTSTNFQLIGKVNKFIFDNLNTSLGVSAVAKHLDMSQSHLRLVFRTCFHMSLGKYIQKLKMDKAKLELSLSEKSIKKIAINLGYSSINSFSGSFKRFWGINPSEYKKQNNGTDKLS
jgi:AraC family transcriptional regulator